MVRSRGGSRVRFWQGPAVDNMERGVIEQQQSGASGVDDAGIGEDRQQCRSSLEGLGRLVTGRLEDSAEARALSPSICRRLGGLPDHSEDRSLDRISDRRVGALRRGGQRGCEQRTVDGGMVGYCPGEPAQDLRQDHPAVAPRSHQRSVGDAGAHGGHVVTGAVEFFNDGPQSQRHVGSGVAVRHRIDVEVVDHLPVIRQRFTEGRDDASKGGCVNRVERHSDRWYFPRVVRANLRAVRSAVMQGVIKSFDPGTGDGVLINESDLDEVDLADDALEGSVFRMLRQGQRVQFDLDGSGRATALRLGSEVDMSTPEL